MPDDHTSPINGDVFSERRRAVVEAHRSLSERSNRAKTPSNGIFERWENPIVTASHVPPNWRYDFNPQTNPHFLERLGISATLNAGAIYLDGRHHLVVRVEGYDRKSFFAIAESNTGTDNFCFWEKPVELPQLEDPETNAYDMRVTEHEDGWTYGLYCAERRDHTQLENTSAANAQCAIVRTKDLRDWERLPDLVTPSGQQRNVVLHPEFVDGKYGLYTRPQDSFISVGAGGGIGWACVDSMTDPVVVKERVIDPKVYHTIKEMKNGQGPAPIKSRIGWLHLAHGVRNTAAGLRYVLYMFVTDLNEPWIVTHRPGGMFLGPVGGERVGDVSNVVFCNGWTMDEQKNVFIYYASSDTRMHVATSDLERLIDYCENTPPDGLFSHVSVEQRIALINSNKNFLGQQ